VSAGEASSGKLSGKLNWPCNPFPLPIPLFRSYPHNFSYAIRFRSALAINPGIAVLLNRFLLSDCQRSDFIECFTECSVAGLTYVTLKLARCNRMSTAKQSGLCS